MLLRSQRIAAFLSIAALGGFLAGAGRARAQDWKQFNDQLTQAGITPSLTYDGDLADTASGGAKRGTTYSSALHMQLGLDGGVIAGVPGLTGWLDGLWIGGGEPIGTVGDAQGVSNIAAPNNLRLYEAWLQYNFADNHLSFLAGLYDLNTEFYRLASADLFLNASFGIGAAFAQSGFQGPSIYPNPNLGVRFTYKPTAETVVRTAVLDGAPLDPQDGSPSPFNRRNGVLLVAEAVLLDRPDNSIPADTESGADSNPVNRRFRIGRDTNPLAYDGKIAIGAWYYTARFDAIEAANADGTPTRHHESGAYLLVDHVLFRLGGDPKRRVTGFVQAGLADPTAERFSNYLGTGLTAFGVLPSRPEDELGIGMAMARNGSPYIGAQHATGIPVAAAETTFEVSYLVQATPWLAIQPDAQYVIHPNTDPRVPNATVAMVRLEVSF
jgi:porin